MIHLGSYSDFYSDLLISVNKLFYFIIIAFRFILLTLRNSLGILFLKLPSVLRIIIIIGTIDTGEHWPIVEPVAIQFTIGQLFTNYGYQMYLDLVGDHFVIFRSPPDAQMARRKQRGHGHFGAILQSIETEVY